jgi:hypothetical protein
MSCLGPMPFIFNLHTCVTAQVHSTCGGKTEGCIAKGPGDNMFQSTEIIATKQYDMAKSLYQNAAKNSPLKSGVDFRHTYVDMQTVQVQANFSTTGMFDHLAYC